MSALLGREDGIWKSDLVPVQGVLALSGVVDGSVSKQDIVIHTVEKERCECDHKQKLTVRMRLKKKMEIKHHNSKH